MVKREHYIPRFYLNRFAENEIISAYNFQTKQLFEVNTKNIGCKNYFYDIDPKELSEELELYKKIFNISEDDFNDRMGDKQFLEKTFSRLESKTASYFNKFENDYSLISDNDFLSTLYLFMKTLSVRTLNYRKGLENISIQTAEWLKSLNAKNVINYPLDKSPEQISKINQLKEIISLPRLYKKSISFFENYEIFVGVNNTGFDFLISDNPLMHFSMGFNDICFPINPKLSIIMQVKNVDKEFKVCDLKFDENKICYLNEKEVLKYNILQCNSSAMYLFGKKKMIEAQLMFIEYIESKKNNGGKNG